MASTKPREVYLQELADTARVTAQYNESFPNIIAYVYILLTLFMCIKNPRAGFIFLVGSIIIRFQDRVNLLSSFPVFALMTLFLFLGMIMHKDSLVIRERPQDKVLLYFLGLGLVGLLIHNPAAIFQSFYAILSAVAFYFFATRLIDTKEDVLKLTLFISFLCAILGAEALYNVSGNPDVTPFLASAGKGTRMQGLGYYSNANEFGFLMIMGLPYLVAVLLRDVSIVKKFAAGFIITLCLIAMAKAGSRTVMVCLMLMFGIIMIFKGEGNMMNKLMVAGVFGVLVLAVLSVIPGPIHDRLMSIRDFQTDASFQGRVRAWDQGFFMVGNYPFTGIGLRQWGEHHGLAAHNSYVQVMAETGLIGLFLYLRLIWLSFKEFSPIKTLGVDKDLKLISLSVMASFSGYLLYIFFGNQAYTVSTFLYIGLCGAVGNVWCAHFKKLEEEAAAVKSTNKEGVS